jgi:nitroreductase
MGEAPIYIVIVGEPEKASKFYGVRGESLYTIQSCAAAVENMMLAACDAGLGSCWVGAFDEDKVKSILNMPEDVTVQAILTIGYADEKPEMPPRRELEHTVYLDRWGGKGQGYSARGYASVALKEAIDDAKGALKRVSKNLKK